MLHGYDVSFGALLVACLATWTRFVLLLRAFWYGTYLQGTGLSWYEQLGNGVSDTVGMALVPTWLLMCIMHVGL